MTQTSTANNNKLPTIHEATASSTNKNDPSSSEPRPCFSLRCVDLCLDWFVFPILLFIQFGATLYTTSHSNNDSLVVPPAYYCMSQVALFCVVAGIYRNVLRRSNHHNNIPVMIMLLPELFTNLLLAWVMMGRLDTALVILEICSLMLLSIMGCVSCIVRNYSSGAGETKCSISTTDHYYQPLLDDEQVV